MKILTAFVVALIISPMALAANGGPSYGGVQYAMVEVDFDGIGDVEPTALVGRFGKFFNDNVAAEGRFGIGLQDDDIIGVDVDVDTIIGGYVAFYSSSTAETNFYGVLGYTRGELDFSGPGGSDSDDESSMSFGFGANIGALNIEYMSYIDEDDVDATAVSIGYIARF